MVLKRHFICVLGTSPYTDCVYEIEGTEFAYKTPFVQMAVLKYIMPETQPEDQITVLLTEKAYAANWVDREYSERELENLRNQNMILKPGQKRAGLERHLAEAFPDIAVETVMIPEGRNKKELNKIFEAIYNNLGSDEMVYFDFTHGLRNIPMQALAVIHYAKALKNIKVGGLYYGAFELGKQGDDGIRHVNVLDMSFSSEILDWTNAAQAFVKGGSSNQIKELYTDYVDKDEKKKIGSIVNSLYDLTNCLNTSRGKATGTAKNSIQKAYMDFKRKFDEMQERSHEISEEELMRLFERIGKDVAKFNRKLYAAKEDGYVCLENTSIGMAAVEWDIEKNLTQQGFTALEETVKTYLCEMYGMEAEKQRDRELVNDPLKFAGKKYNDERHQNKKSGSAESFNIEKYRDEYYKELSNSEKLKKLSEDEKNPYSEKLVNILVHLPEKLIRMSVNVTDMRNTINHFGFQENASSYEKLQRRLEELYVDLQNVMEESDVVSMDGSEQQNAIPER